MREQQSRLTLIILVVLIWGASFFFLSRQSSDTSAEGEQEATATAVTVNLDSAIVAEDNDLTLAIQIDDEDREVKVGDQVHYTISFKNEQAESITPQLVNTLATDLNLEPDSLQATKGLPLAGDNVFNWSDTLAPGEEVVITYSAHPNYFSEPGQTLNNSTTVTAGDTVLENNLAIINRRTWEKQLIVGIATVLDYMAAALAKISIPYAYGFAIIIFTVAVRAATFPLNKKQIESTKATQEMQPKLKALQKKYEGDREKLAQEQMKLYKEHGINPVGGCLPMLIQMPIWLSLYRALFHLANDTTSLNEGFLWIPSLAGPVGPITNGMSGSATWMLPWSDAFLGWPDSLAYLVLPVLLVVSQIYMQKTMTPQSDDPQQKMMGQMMMFMPFMFGYFALVVPAGLSVYWITSNLLGVVQQKYFTQIKENNDKNSASDSSKTSQTPSLEMSPATASIENSSDSEGQVSNNARRKSRSKKRRRKK